MRSQLVTPDRPPAVVCYGDYHALGLMKACCVRGIRVPEELSITGFNDLEAARMAPVQLTTASHDARQFGREAARLIFDIMEGKPATSVLLPPKLVIRPSIGPPPPTEI